MKLTKNQALALSTYYNEAIKTNSLSKRIQLERRILLHTPIIELTKLIEKYPSLIL